MNCPRVVNLMSAHVDGELTGEEMLAIRRHISGCPECEREYEEVRWAKQAVARLASVAPGEGLVDSIITRLDEVEAPAYQRALNSLGRLVHQRLSPVAAALTASGVALIIMSAGGIETPRPQANEMASGAPYMVQKAGLVGEGSIPIAMQEPLVVADYRADFTQPTIHLTGLSTR